MMVGLLPDKTQLSSSFLPDFFTGNHLNGQVNLTTIAT
jgi:hypothetical protein